MMLLLLLLLVVTRMLLLVWPLGRAVRLLLLLLRMRPLVPVLLLRGWCANNGSSVSVVR